jgi:hypothetical protein
MDSGFARLRVRPGMTACLVYAALEAAGIAKTA